MGYTHYWRREKDVDSETFSKIVGDFQKLLPLFKTLDLQLAGWDGNGEPVITDEEIRFNGNANCGHKQLNFGGAGGWPSDTTKFGVAPDQEGAVDRTWYAGVMFKQRTCDGDCSHETFAFPMEMTLRDYDRPDENGRYFAFCKTLFKPYDLAVITCLIIIKHYLRNRIYVSSDGKLGAWQDGMKICQNAFGYGEDFKLDR
jgi:hypothetical protein